MKLKEIIHNLKQPIPTELISTRELKGKVIPYIKWANLTDLLDERAGEGNWSWEIVETTITPCTIQRQSTTKEGYIYTHSYGSRIILKGRLTLFGDDRILTMDSTGQEELTTADYGDPSSNAEAMSLRRCCAKPGLGRSISTPKPATKHQETSGKYKV